jgi:hypothetical protein
MRRFHHVVPLSVGIAAFLFLSGAMLNARDSNAAQAQSRLPYANSAEGLKLFLMDGVAAAKGGDKSKLNAFMQDTSISHAYDWFIATYGEKDGASRVGKYGSNVSGNEKDVRDSIVRIARVAGEIRTRSVNDHPEPGSEIESDLVRGLKRPTRFYYAEWIRQGAQEAEEGEFIGYFVFATGKFRIATVSQSVVTLHGVRNPKTGAIEYVLPVLAKPSIKGTKYKNSAGHFTLDLPGGWTINEGIASAPMAIGALSDPDGGANAVIQLIPINDSPSEFVQALEKEGPTMFVDYKKVATSEMVVDGEDAASLTLTQTDSRSKMTESAPPRTLEWFVVVVRVQGGDIVLTSLRRKNTLRRRERYFDRLLIRFVWTCVEIGESGN